MKKEKITTTRPDILELEPAIDEQSCLPFVAGVVVAILAFVSYLIFMKG